MKTVTVIESSFKTFTEGLRGGTYMIPVMGWSDDRIPVENLKPHVSRLLARAHINPDWKFDASTFKPDRYEIAELAPLFRDAPPNCVLPDEFKKWLEEN